MSVHNGHGEFLRVGTRSVDTPTVGRITQRFLAPTKRTSLTPHLGSCLIHEETAWRSPGIFQRLDLSVVSALASRWQDSIKSPHEETARAPTGHYVIELALRKTSIAMSVADEAAHDGLILPGMIQVTGPGRGVHALFRGPSHFLHFYIDSRFVEMCYADMAPRAPPAGITFATGFTHDATVEQLGRALLSADLSRQGPGTLYTDGICLAIVARLIDLHLRDRLTPRAFASLGLAQWQLRRALDFIEDRLAEPLTLADLASAVGLSRMHFAARFRAATGLRPHEYVLRRRIERSQNLLLNPRFRALDAALSVGFQTQAHFTTVFKRFCGITPHRWRMERGVDTSIAAS